MFPINDLKELKKNLLEGLSDLKNNLFPDTIDDSTRYECIQCENEIILLLEIPSAKKELINIKADKSGLTITGKTQRIIDVDEKKCTITGTIQYYSNINIKVIQNYIDKVQVDKITSTYENGILKIVLPLKAEFKEKMETVEIKVS